MAEEKTQKNLGSQELGPKKGPPGADPRKKSTGFVLPSPHQEEEGRDGFLRRLIPVGTATPGRSIKLRDLFTLSGIVECDPTVTTVTASVVTTTETDLASLRFFKDEFHRNIAIRITASGTYTSDGTRTVTLRIGRSLAPTTEWNSMVSTAASTTDAPWNLTWTGIVATIGASGTLEAQMQGRINNVNKDDANNAAVAFDTTVTNVLALTAQWSASNAGNSITIRQFTIEILN